MPRVPACQVCNKPFPTGASSRRKYCDETCRKRSIRAKAKSKSSSRNDQLVTLEVQNDELQKEIERLSAQLAKAENQAKHFRDETRKVQTQRDNLAADRREQYQELRANYRLAHVAVIRLGQQLSLLVEAPALREAEWQQLGQTEDAISDGSLAIDKKNAATLVQAVSETMALLDDAVRLSHHMARTAHKNRENTNQINASETYYSQEQIEQIIHDRNIYRDTTHKQREQMQIAKKSHTKLLKQYADQKATISQLLSERQMVKVIISQWLILSRELYRRTGGRPSEKRHQKILSTWKQYEIWATKGSSK